MSHPPENPKRWVEDESATQMARLLRALLPASPPPVAQERVWKRMLRTSTDRPVRPWSIAAGAALGAVAVALVVTSERSPVARQMDPSAPQASSTWVHDGERLSTGAQSRWVRFEDVGALLGQATTAQLHRRGWRGKRLEIELTEGSVVVADAPRPRERAFRVLAGPYQVEVVGTIFSVNSHGGQVEVRVQEGGVEVTGPGVAVSLHAGESWSNREGAGRAPLPAAQAQQVLQLFSGDVAAAAPSPPVPAAPPAAQVEQAPVTVPTTAATAPVHHRALPVGPAAPTATPGAAPSIEAAQTPPAPVPPSPPGAVDEVESLRAKLAGVTTAEERQALNYELGKALSAHGDAFGAVAAYGVAAEGKGPHAEVALYEVGRLRLRQLGDAPGAADAFALALTRFPQGQLTAEVQLSQIEALLETREYDAAASSMDAFLTRFPNSERRLEVVRLRADLRRERGDCRGAVADYGALLDSASGDDALYYSAFCRQALGESEEAHRLLERYRQRFPAGRHARDVAQGLAVP